MGCSNGFAIRWEKYQRIANPLERMERKERMLMCRGGLHPPNNEN